MNISVLIILAFALVFACIEAWKGSSTIRPASFGWLAIALLIVTQIFYRGHDVFFK